MYDRGAVWTAKIPEVGLKPVVLLSHRSVTLAMRPVAARITSVERPRDMPTAVELAQGEVDGLSEHSHVLCHDLMTVQDGGLVTHLGRISQEHMLEVERRLAFVFGIGRWP